MPSTTLSTAAPTNASINGTRTAATLIACIVVTAWVVDSRASPGITMAEKA